MRLTTFQQELLLLFTEAGVEFVIIGGIAMKAHGIARETRDLDLLVSRRPATSTKLYGALAPMIAASRARVTPEQLQLPKKLISLPNRERQQVDILTSIGALDTEAAIADSPTGTFGTVGAKYLGLKELIYTKVVSAEANLAPEAKERDLNDLAALLKHWQSAA